MAAHVRDCRSHLLYKNWFVLIPPLHSALTLTHCILPPRGNADNMMVQFSPGVTIFCRMVQVFLRWMRPRGLFFCQTSSCDYRGCSTNPPALAAQHANSSTHLHQGGCGGCSYLLLIVRFWRCVCNGQQSQNYATDRGDFSPVLEKRKKQSHVTIHLQGGFPPKNRLPEGNTGDLQI